MGRRRCGEDELGGEGDDREAIGGGERSDQDYELHRALQMLKRAMKLASSDRSSPSPPPPPPHDTPEPQRLARRIIHRLAFSGPRDISRICDENRSQDSRRSEREKPRREHHPCIGRPRSGLYRYRVGDVLRLASRKGLRQVHRAPRDQGGGAREFRYVDGLRTYAITLIGASINQYKTLRCVKYKPIVELLDSRVRVTKSYLSSNKRS